MSVVARIAQLATDHPDRVAVRCHTHQFTRAQLNRRASGVARWLGKTVPRGTLVGLHLPKSPEYAAAMLGCWHAGCPFTPLEPSLPKARLAELIEDSGARAVVGDPIGGLQHLPDPPEAEPLYELPAPAPESPAYLLYTSGSTGRPKGVWIAHRGLMPLLDAQISAFELGEGDRTLGFLPTQFDASISDFGTALLSGATHYLPAAAEVASTGSLLSVLRRERITVADLPPALLSLIEPGDWPESLRTVVIGGEACSADVARRHARQLRLINVYGPTETTVCSSLCQVHPEDWRRPLLGEPLAGTRFYLLDETGSPVCAKTGELGIGGIGVAIGYHNRPEETAARFIQLGGDRVYRTGDRVEKRGETYVFVGRTDRQIQRQSKRLEPEEIERVLSERPGVHRVAVAEHQDGALVAWFSGTAEGADLRRHLERTLPAWMIPNAFIRMDRLPEGPAGKVELRRLTQGELSVAPVALSPCPSTAILHRLVQVALGQEISVHDDFFEAGGDSFRLLRFVAEAQATGIALQPEEVLEHRTVANMAKHARARTGIDSATLRGEAARRAPARLSGQRPGKPDTVLLTGATGSLGRAVLESLLAHSTATVYCTVRARDPAHAAARLNCQEPRVHPLVADLEVPNYGLDDRTWAMLADTVDAVVHCAARVHLVEPLGTLSGPNVDGITPLQRLCSTGRPKRMHYASTLSVFVSTDQNTGWLRESDGLGDTRVYGGYAQSKWVAEALIREGARRGHPANVYRFGLITGDSETGVSARHDFLALFLRGLSHMRGVPRAAAAFSVDVTPIDFAAKAMARLILKESEDPIQTFHIANPSSATLRDLVAAMRRAGTQLTWLDGAEWDRERGRALALGDPSATAAVVALCRALGEQGFEALRTVDLFQATGVRFCTARTTAALPDLRCPPPNPPMLERYARAALRGSAE